MSIAPSRARLERGAASSSHAFGGTAAPRHAVLFRNIVLAARWTVYTLTKDNKGFRRLTVRLLSRRPASGTGGVGQSRDRDR